jgi:FKBP-type peptidyl-prolyl cis-trans isomerase FklB
MKRVFRIALVSSVIAVCPSLVGAAESATIATNQHERISYSVGMYIANNFLKPNGLDVDVDVMAQGIKDVLAGRDLKISEQESQQVLMAYRQELRAKREQERAALAEKNRAAGETFMTANRQKPDVKSHQVTIPNSVPPGSTNPPAVAELQYKVLAEGSGESPAPGAVIAFRARGTTIDGKEFENTTTQPEPVRTPLNRVGILGLREALQMMKPGAKWQVYVPSSLAYGDYPGPNIEPGSLLIYDVELVSFQSPEPLTSDIIKVPSAEELARGAKIEVIKAEDLKRMQQTNSASGNP